MNPPEISRRRLLQFLGSSAGLSLVPSALKPNPVIRHHPNFIYCMNMATLRGHRLGMVKELEVISRAGFRAAEIWMDTLETYLREGGTLAELKKILNDLGLTVVNAIGFSEWIVNDQSARLKAIEQLKKEMDMLAQIGCKRIAAPPAGATEHPGLDYKKAAQRYRAILDLGDKTGVVPHLELWGFSANLSKLSEVMFVAIESGHPDARVLLDNFHLYKGGTDLNSLPLVSHSAVEIFHMNDYPKMPAATITDGDRVLPGDGISPLSRILGLLNDPSCKLVLSVEIFNKKYDQMAPFAVAELSLKKLKAIAESV